MISRLAIASIAIGLILLAGGMFLSEGYSAKHGFLGSLPKMKIRLIADERYARFSQVLKSDPVDEGILELPASYSVAMGDMEINQVAQAFEAQRLGSPKPGYIYSFNGWAVQRGTTIPLGPALAIASALVIVGAAVLVGARVQRYPTREAAITGTEQAIPSSAELTTRPKTSEAETPVTRSRLRLGLHLWGGICVKAAADVSGLVVVRGSGDVDSALAAAVAAGLIAVLLILAGYYLSYQLVAALDRTSIAPQAKKTILILLPVAYFVGAILVGGVAGLLAGSS